MTIKEFIKGKFKGFGVQISEADLLDISLLNKLNEEDEMSPDNYDSVRRAIARFIPSLLLRPSISEGGFSLTVAQKSNIETYYSMECKTLGLPNNLPRPKITFL